MTYFIFDMDETLAELHSVFYFIASLRIVEIIRESGDEIPPILDKSLKNAYKIFISNVLIEELSLNPLGILRPGILNVMKKLYKLQKLGRLTNVVIYSNNGHLESLEFIRDLIHTYLGTNNLIKDCIHWDHFMREEETRVRYGQPTKTWNVLKNILVMSHCQASDAIQQRDVYFFDDQDHIDLQKNLGSNYYKVPPYTFRASFDRIAEIYKKAIVNVNFELFYNVLSNIFKIKTDRTINGLLESFKEKTGRTDDTLPPEPDIGIDIMMEAINKISIIGGKRQRAKTKKRKPQDHIPQKKLKTK